MDSKNKIIKLVLEILRDRINIEVKDEKIQQDINNYIDIFNSLIVYFMTGEDIYLKSIVGPLNHFSNHFKKEEMKIIQDAIRKIGSKDIEEILGKNEESEVAEHIESKFTTTGFADDSLTKQISIIKNIKESNADDKEIKVYVKRFFNKIDPQLFKKNIKKAIIYFNNLNRSIMEIMRADKFFALYEHIEAYIEKKREKIGDLHFTNEKIGGKINDLLTFHTDKLNDLIKVDRDTILYKMNELAKTIRTNMKKKEDFDQCYEDYNTIISDEYPRSLRAELICEINNNIKQIRNLQDEIKKIILPPSNEIQQKNGWELAQAILDYEISIKDQIYLIEKKYSKISQCLAKISRIWNRIIGSNTDSCINHVALIYCTYFCFSLIPLVAEKRLKKKVDTSKEINKLKSLCSLDEIDFYNNSDGFLWDNIKNLVEKWPFIHCPQ